MLNNVNNKFENKIYFYLLIFDIIISFHELLEIKSIIPHILYSCSISKTMNIMNL